MLTATAAAVVLGLVLGLMLVLGLPVVGATAALGLASVVTFVPAMSGSVAVMSVIGVWTGGRAGAIAVPAVVQLGTRCAVMRHRR